MKVLALVFLLLVSLASVVQADTRTYILPAPGITTDEGAKAAKDAALAVKGVVSAEAFVSNHTIEIEMMDEKAPLNNVIRAINAVGYAVGKPKMKKGGR